MDRTAWQELPSAAREAVEKHTGPVGHAETADTGVMSRLACTLHTASGRVFVKGTRLDDDAAWTYDYEARVTRCAPCAPGVLWEVEAGGWLLIGYEFIVGHHPGLAPGSADLAPLADTLTAMSATPWPGVVRKKPLHVRWSGLFPTDRTSDLEGTALVHTDVSPLNMLVTADGIRLLDWALACPGPDWADTAFAVVRLVHAGHTPGQAEEIARTVPAYRAAPTTVVTTFADALCAVWENRQKTDPLPHRAPLIAAARSWAAHRGLIRE
ncbi:phosphotransferase [Streptomyces phaeolivaceus]|uniref:Phosphotransferase n=1 Tax=Streptomyces phaeolivaceus TaxID=2653200 RepID=A0A5P8K707_9ACTN|nr:phosphotransferase [Streptomyces phaeolivaceus]QFQ98901.1 phosphotransferase [Streptomyces phaeolivaceus]